MPATRAASEELPPEVHPVAPELPIGAFLVQFLLVTLLMGAVAYAALRVVRDRFPGLGRALHRGGRSLRLVDRVALDAQRAAFIVAVGSRHWLLAASGDHVTTVAELSADDLGVSFATLVAQEGQPDAQA
ncbi:MAG: flagellar biosynthetic protein FliO [Candidatus Sericytochromatia bacterium]|nr:flagellar biosynthetic protein FliO [Candidatus Sericytochromatia bacterium]